MPAAQIPPRVAPFVVHQVEIGMRPHIPGRFSRLRCELVRLTSTSWRVDFSRPVVRTSVALWAGTYSFDPPLAVLSVSSANTTNISSVVLTCEEQGPFEYTVRVEELEEA